jgi:hypothetical protein
LVDRLVALGARHIDVGQGPNDRHVVLADPEGNELCIIEPGNKFLAGCGRLGSITCDGPPEVGYFWSGALVAAGLGSGRRNCDPKWTAPVRSSRGGRLLSRRSVRTDFISTSLRPPMSISSGSRPTRCARATRIDIGQGDVSWVVMADPDGNEFCVLTPR